MEMSPPPPCRADKWCSGSGPCIVPEASAASLGVEGPAKWARKAGQSSLASDTLTGLSQPWSRHGELQLPLLSEYSSLEQDGPETLKGLVVVPAS